MQLNRSSGFMRRGSYFEQKQGRVVIILRGWVHFEQEQWFCWRVKRG